MNKSEAIEAMRSGKRVTHNTFISGEYVTMKDESIVDEDGNILDEKEFWSFRSSEIFNEGWSLYPSNGLFQYIEIVSFKNKEVVKRIDVTEKNEKQIERLEYAININLNHQNYFTTVSKYETEQPKINID